MAEFYTLVFVIMTFIHFIHHFLTFEDDIRQWTEEEGSKKTELNKHTPTCAVNESKKEYYFQNISQITFSVQWHAKVC